MNQTHLHPLPIFTASLDALIQLDRKSQIPLYRQISHVLREAIRKGQLKEGIRLPTERALARSLAVNRTTVMNAYNELRSEGLIEGHVGRGTLVKQRFLTPQEDREDDSLSWLASLAPVEASALGADLQNIHNLASLPDQHDFISFAANVPALDLLPTHAFQQLIEEKLVSASTQALGYSPVEGSLRLREAITQRMQERGIPIDLTQVLVLSGSTQGIGLVGRLLLQPGDTVIVESPSYLGAIHAFQALGAKIISVPIDSEGIRVDLLETLLNRYHPRLIYTLPTFQNPTGIVMSEERKRRLLFLAHKYQVPILEDDPYGEIYYASQAPRPLKSYDKKGHVIYLSTFSKVLAPGLRVAWLAAPEAMIGRLSLYKQIFDLNSNSLGQWLIAELMQQPFYGQHLRYIRQAYQSKRDLMVEAVRRYWPSETRLREPEGGFHLWCRLPGSIRARQLLREAAQAQVAFVVGEPFHIDGGGENHLRLSFGAPREDQIEEGIRRLGKILTRLCKE